MNQREIDGVRDCRHAAFANIFDARVPSVRRADSRRGIAERSDLERFGGIDAEPLAERSADRKAAKMCARDFQRIEQAKHVLRQVLQSCTGPE